MKRRGTPTVKGGTPNPAGAFAPFPTYLAILLHRKDWVGAQCAGREGRGLLIFHW